MPSYHQLFFLEESMYWNLSGRQFVGCIQIYNAFQCGAASFLYWGVETRRDSTCTLRRGVQVKSQVPGTVRKTMGDLKVHCFLLFFFPRKLPPFYVLQHS